MDVVFERDTTAPLIGAKSPDAGAQNVGLGAKVAVTFNEAMDAASLSAATIYLSPAPGGTARGGLRCGHQDGDADAGECAVAMTPSTR